jgi:ABC-type transport system involved in multi-copper enzyme maturation permease subunit
MKGLVLKDLYNLKKYGKTVFLISGFFIMIIFMMGNADLFLGMIVLMLTLTSITSFAYDSQSGWEIYVSSLPVSRKEVVLSKYVLSLLLALTGGLVALLVGWVNGLIKNSSNFTESLVFSYSLFAVAVFFISILLPLIYKFGEERSRLVVIAIVAVPTAIFLVLGQTGNVVAPDEQTIRRLVIWSPLVLVACSVLSFAVSNAIYRGKEG